MSFCKWFHIATAIKSSFSCSIWHDGYLLNHMTRNEMLESQTQPKNGQRLTRDQQIHKRSTIAITLAQRQTEAENSGLRSQGLHWFSMKMNLKQVLVANTHRLHLVSCNKVCFLGCGCSCLGDLFWSAHLTQCAPWLNGPRCVSNRNVWSTFQMVPFVTHYVYHTFWN